MSVSIERQAHKDRAERLSELESVIERHVRSFLEVGAALLEVRDTKLYLVTHRTFETWVQLRFKISRRRAYELIAATKVNENLERRGVVIVPSSEREARELAKFEPDAQETVWEHARELAGDEPPTGVHVRRAGREIRRLEQVDQLAQQNQSNEGVEALGMYPIILADPPWQYDSGTTDPTRQVENQYPTMPADEIAALDIESHATADAVLFMWAPPSMLPDALAVIEAWGFTYKTHGVWDKGLIGGGYWMRIRHEDLLIAVRGKPPHPNPSDLWASVFLSRKTAHSEKPVCVYEMIERYYPTLSKVELFARSERAGWKSWGNEHKTGASQ